MPAMGNQVGLRIDGNEIADLPNGKLLTRRLKRGDGFILRSGGGGGFGSPHRRDPERVAHDVRQGYVSRKAARELYGVELMDEGNIDAGATQRLRSREDPGRPVGIGPGG